MLAYDVARCSGVTGRAECLDCLRRLCPGDPERQWHTSPPNETPCPLKITIEEQA